jgi:hypothetical protein
MRRVKRLVKALRYSFALLPGKGKKIGASLRRAVPYVDLNYYAYIQ